MGRTAVIGVVFVDVKGFPHGKYIPTGRNIGDVKIVHGGVSRNVAQNLANVGNDVTFVTMFEPDALGSGVRANLAANGVDLTYAIEAPAGMGIWLAVMNENGDLAGSISRQPDSSRLDALFQERGDEIMQNCDDVVLEIDMRASIADRVFELAEKHRRDIYVIVGNMGVILKRQTLLSRARLIVMNEIEAGLLFGCTLDPADPERVLEVTRIEAKKRDLKQIVVTLGVHGSIYFDSRNGDAGFVPAEPTRLVDSTGAGDAFFSGTVDGLIHGMNLRDACARGAHLASLTIQTEENTCPRIHN